MSREQRAHDNWALLYAQELAQERDVALCVVFCLVPEYMDATWRQYSFMIRGLRETEADLVGKDIEFRLLSGLPWVELPPFLHEVGAGVLVTDFDPVRTKVEWKKKVVGGIPLPVVEVDAHNTVPCWMVASHKMESFEKYRDHLAPYLDDLLTEYPPLADHGTQVAARSHRLGRRRSIRCGWTASVGEVDWIVPGQSAAMSSLHEFCPGQAGRLSDQGERPLAGWAVEHVPLPAFRPDVRAEGGLGGEPLLGPAGGEAALPGPAHRAGGR